MENVIIPDVPVGFDPVNNPIDALRLEFGDLDEYNYILTDQSYQYFLNKYPNSPRMVSKSVGMTILAKFAKEGYRQKVGQEEAYLSERYKNYLDWLKQKTTNPMLSGSIPAVYVGGVNRDIVTEYELRPDLIDSMFFQGQHAKRPYWLNKRYACESSVKEVEENTKRIVE